MMITSFWKKVFWKISSCLARNMILSSCIIMISKEKKCPNAQITILTSFLISVSVMPADCSRLKTRLLTPWQDKTMRILYQKYTNITKLKCWNSQPRKEREGSRKPEKKFLIVWVRWRRNTGKDLFASKDPLQFTKEKGIMSNPL